MADRPPSYILGLDPGKETDPAALVAVSRRERPGPGGWAESWYAIEGLIHFPLRTPYVDQPQPDGSVEPGLIESVRRVIASKPALQGCSLALDKTGIGDPVVDMFRAARPQLNVWIRPIWITSGERSSLQPDGTWHVPKAELVTNLDVLVQNRRIVVNENCPPAMRAKIEEELRALTRKATKTGKTKMEAESGKHDDIALAISLAAWLGENSPVGWDGTLASGGHLPIPKDVFLQPSPPASSWPTGRDPYADRPWFSPDGLDKPDEPGSFGFGSSVPGTDIPSQW